MGNEVLDDCRSVLSGQGRARMKTIICSRHSRLAILACCSFVWASTNYAQNADPDTDPKFNAAALSQKLHSYYEVETVLALWSIAQAGDEVRGLEGRLAAMLVGEDWRAKRQSHWVYYALTKISRAPGKHLDAYARTAAWLHYNVVPVGQVGVIGGPPPPGRHGPKLPGELQIASRQVWTVCVDSLTAEIRKAKDKRRRAIFDCLEKMEAPEEIIVPRLASMVLDDKLDLNSRWAATNLIGRYGHVASSIPHVLKCLEVRDGRLRGAIAYALGSMCYPHDPYGSWTGPPRHPDVKRALAVFKKLLTDDAPRVRTGATCGLRVMERQSAPLIGEMTRLAAIETDGSTLYNLAIALAKSESPQAVRPLLDLFTDEGLIKRLKQRPADSTGGTTYSLENWARSARASAAEALGTLAYRLNQHNKQAMPALAEAALPSLIAAFSEDKRIALTVAKSAGFFGSHAKPAVEPLRELLRKYGDARPTQTIIFAFGHIGPNAKTALPDILAMPPSRGVAWATAIALGKIGVGGERVEAKLVGILKTNTDYICREAAESLGKLAQPNEKVIRALNAQIAFDENEEIVQACEKALRAILGRSKQPPPGGDEDQF